MGVPIYGLKNYCYNMLQYVPLNRRVCFLLLWLWNRVKYYPSPLEVGFLYLPSWFCIRGIIFYWAAFGRASCNFRLLVMCVEKRPLAPRGGKTWGLGPRNDFLTTCFPIIPDHSRSNLGMKLHSPVSFLITVWNGVSNSCHFVWNRSRISKAQQHTLMVNLRE